MEFVRALRHSRPSHVSGMRSGTPVMAALGTLLLGLLAASLLIGPTSIPPAVALATLAERLSGGDALHLRESIILFDIRLPRTLMGAMVGAGLAVAGALMQGLFRNPLADPGLIGVSAGAGLAAVASIVFLGGVTVFGSALLILPLAAFLGGLATTITLYLIATRDGRTSVGAMLLGGIALAALAAALTGYLIFLSDDQQLRDITFWTMGSLGGATWARIATLAPFVLAALVAIPFLGHGLNALLLGEAAAFHMGFDTQRLKRSVIVLSAGVVGACVASSGVIGFVGIIVPHVLRLAVGSDHRLLLPGCALAGAGLLVGADILSRVLVAPAELPIGIITAILGAPVFLSILMRRRAVVDI